MHLDLDFHSPGTVRWLRRAAARKGCVYELPAARKSEERLEVGESDGDKKILGVVGCLPGSLLGADCREEGFGGD